MKKIKLTESDLLKIVKRVLNEQDDRQLDLDMIEFLHNTFIRELKPPFRKGEMDKYGYYPYYNQDGEEIGQLAPMNRPTQLGRLSSGNDFKIKFDPYFDDILAKVFQAFESDDLDVYNTIIPHLKSWMEDQLDVELRYIG